MRYAVDTTSLDGDADVVEVVLTRLGRVRPGDDLDGLARDLPGGETANAAGRVVQAWRERMASVGRQLRGLGAALAAASDAYGRVESVARSALASRRGGAGS
jgi:hypothetical protein